MTAATAAGDELPVLRRRVTQAQIDAYADAAGDPNPIHTDEEVARSFGFPTTIAHGMLTMAILAESVARYAGAYDRVAGLAVRFSRPLLRGDTLVCTGRVGEVDAEGGVVHLEVGAASEGGDRVLTNGRATVRLHPHPTR
ncbi:MAG TPA: MaoC/PaaZ C-terminal domain-containing protein [Candidatus Dormibacteraeota bacterium]|nr:MaoC/PaaZ C-terminal domain-containing protein [Candidatus Dormibacteraeota bacterium]